jgi:replication factor C large subunit
MRLSYDLDDTPETVEQWVEGNMHLLSSPSAVAKGYRSLSRADEYLGYTYRRQYHTLWRYATALMLLGVADAAGGKGIHTRIMPPERWQKMSSAKKQKAIRMITLAKFGSIMHIPQTTLRENYLDIISLLVEHDPAAYASEMMLDADQLNYFLHDKARSTEIIKFLLQEEKARVKEQQNKSLKEKQQKAGLHEQKKPLKEKSEKPILEYQKETVPEPPAEKTVEKKQPSRSQSTLFDGF